MQIPINIFKGLYTNIDSADLEPTYFTRAENVKVYPGFIKGEGYNLTQENYPEVFGDKIVYYDFVFMDDDKYKNILRDGELVYDYIQNIQKHTILITYGTNQNTTGYFIFMDGVHIGTHTSDDATQYPFVINDKGVCKVLFKERAYLLAKYNRLYWTYGTGFQSNPQFLGPNTNNLEGYRFYPLVKTLNVDGQQALLNFDLETSASPPTIIDIYINKVIDGYEYSHPNGNRFIYCKAVEFKDIDGHIVPFSNETGYLLLLRASLVDGSGNLINSVWAFWKGHDELQPHPTNYFTWDLTKVRWQVEINGEPDSVVLPDFGLPENWAFMTEEQVEEWLGPPENYNVFQYNITNVALENGFENTDITEAITTVVIGDNEFPVNYKKLSATNKYVMKVTPNYGNISTIYPEKIAIKIYIRNKTTAADIETRDFELCYTIPLVSGKQVYYPKYIDSLTPNGIFLSQTIGKAVDIDTYKIETAFDDYVSVGGVSFILKNGNILYPTVGDGIIHTDMFYAENYIPGVSGNWLTSYANTLGVFKKDEEVLTLVDFQPVEATMLFYIKDQLGYRIKDYQDIVETTDGTFILLREGIYIINQSDRQWLSEAINDIVEAAYDNGSGRIYYNTYAKELYFLTSLGYYVLRFNTRTWSKFTLNLPKYLAKPIKNITGPQEADPVIDVIDDYEGNVYFLTEQYKYKLISGIPKQGTLKTVYLGGNELSMKKILESTRYDINGKVIWDNKTKETEGRKILRIFNHIRKRIPRDGIDIEFKFEGTLYGAELTIEGVPYERL